MYEFRRISYSLANSLWKGKEFLAFAIFYLWLFFGPPFLCQYLLKGWHGSFVSKSRKKIWRTTPLCLFWILWQEKNQRYFDGIQPLDQAVKDFVICPFFHQTHLLIQGGPGFLLDFIDWLHVSQQEGVLYPLLKCFRVFGSLCIPSAMYLGCTPHSSFDVFSIFSVA